MDSTQRKIQELKKLTTYDDESIVIKSPYFNDPNTNACIKEQNLSAKCALENYANRDLCLEAMENYQICEKFWGHIQRVRYLSGIKPSLPPPDERGAIIAKERERIEELKAWGKRKGLI